MRPRQPRRTRAAGSCMTVKSRASAAYGDHGDFVHGASSPCPARSSTALQRSMAVSSTAATCLVCAQWRQMNVGCTPLLDAACYPHHQRLKTLKAKANKHGTHAAALQHGRQQRSCSQAAARLCSQRRMLRGRFRGRTSALPKPAPPCLCKWASVHVNHQQPGSKLC
jgi:hypothetical protein